MEIRCFLWYNGKLLGEFFLYSFPIIHSMVTIFIISLTVVYNSAFCMICYPFHNSFLCIQEVCWGCISKISLMQILKKWAWKEARKRPVANKVINSKSRSFFLDFFNLIFRKVLRWEKGISCRHYTISNDLGHFKFKAQNMQYIHALMQMSMAVLWQPRGISEWKTILEYSINFL